MSFTISFTLKQHTPILHFQHDQPGATLRATELKPKLDLFLIKQLGLRFIDSEGWLVGDGSQEALDYKIKVVNGKYDAKAELATKTKSDKDGNTKHITNPEMYPQVLANMGGKDSVKELKMFRMYETVSVEVFSFHKKLLEKISTNFALFIATHNFGNRQSKGFGSFYLDKGDPRFQAPGDILLTSFNNLVYWQLEDDQKFKYTFEDIDIIYRLMKSGFNFPEIPGKEEFVTYQPSFLKNYFLEKYKIGSEKRAIKESLFQPNLRIAKDTSLKGNNYIRAILGTAESFEFRDKRRGEVKIKSEKVERFQSAITFKVFANRVYLLPGDWSTIRDKKFVFETGRDTLQISTPTVDFDLSIFLSEFANWFNGIKDEELERLDDIVANSGQAAPDLIKKYLNCLEKVNLKTLQKPISK